jgi:hypothetical protein
MKVIEVIPAFESPYFIMNIRPRITNYQLQSGN